MPIEYPPDFDFTNKEHNERVNTEADAAEARTLARAYNGRELTTHDRIADIEHRLDEIERAVIAMYKRGFSGDSLSLVEMAPLIERVKLLSAEVRS